ncbi:hypothetical protein GDO86_017220 [Hymenochirus boettgeri]|uniref:Uncharacterized protein n=1 Tax=Hymenochirus boettgeri TaxID=247094 RepID=A0A8T2IP86_9PIPI|nr:hypothetical protein GDO86_017220 [Hymenochirus boettgeri]
MDVKTETGCEDDKELIFRRTKNKKTQTRITSCRCLDNFQEGLAMIVQDPLLCDLPIQVTLEEINSQVALEFGQAITVRVFKADGEIMPVVVVQNPLFLI